MHSATGACAKEIAAFAKDLHSGDQTAPSR
jgi:hypothetical protein